MIVIMINACTLSVATWNDYSATALCCSC